VEPDVPEPEVLDRAFDPFDALADALGVVADAGHDAAAGLVGHLGEFLDVHRRDQPRLALGPEHVLIHEQVLDADLVHLFDGPRDGLVAQHREHLPEFVVVEAHLLGQAAERRPRQHPVLVGLEEVLGQFRVRVLGAGHRVDRLNVHTRGSPMRAIKPRVTRPLGALPSGLTTRATRVGTSCHRQDRPTGADDGTDRFPAARPAGHCGVRFPTG